MYSRKKLILLAQQNVKLRVTLFGAGLFFLHVRACSNGSIS